MTNIFQRSGLKSNTHANGAINTLRLLCILVSVGLLSTACGESNNFDVSNGGISLDESKRIPVAPPEMVQVDRREFVVEIQWKGTRSANVSGYILYRDCENAGWNRVKQVQAVDDNSGLYEMVLPFAKECKYTVSSVSVYGIEGPKSIAVQ